MQAQIKSIEYDSRKVKQGSVFVCIVGEKSDGHDYMETAAQAGASKLIIQRGYENQASIIQEKYPEVIIETVPDTRVALAYLSADFYQQPSKQLTVIGVTGTNGKTTITHLIQNIIGDDCALLGTMGLKPTRQAAYQDTGNTTPQSTEIQKILASLVQNKQKYLAMEVSSHALDQHRTDAIEFSTSIVTNLTQDHLDYHKTMLRYLEAKTKIFKQTGKNAILNADDSYYDRFLQAAQEAGLSTISYGIVNQEQHSNHGLYDIYAENMSFNEHGLSYDLVIPSSSKLQTLNNSRPQTNTRIPERRRFNLKLNGLFNVYNSLAAIAACLAEAIDFAQIQTNLEATEPIAGRFETIKTETSPLCIVDYAHSPDGLDNVLKAARELLRVTNSQGRLICVFGCGGDRDITKRPKMGRIAHDLADFVYITSDNPRSEDPQQIIADILSGSPDLQKTMVIADRALAIQEAIKSAKTEDIVVIAGKGHEDYQILKDRTIHFDDREQVKTVLGL